MVGSGLCYLITYRLKQVICKTMVELKLASGFEAMLLENVYLASHMTLFLYSIGSIIVTIVQCETSFSFALCSRN